MGKHIIEEAKRCLKCKKPKCREGCPVDTPINEMIEKLLDGKIVEAGEQLFTNNPLSVVCSMVCPHEIQCEGHCILNKKSGSVHISTIEQYISDYYLKLMNVKVDVDRNKKVAIVGSGPAGITISFILASKGFDITIFEGYDHIGGVLRYGIPEFRLPKSVLESLKEKLIEMGVKIRPNTLIGPNITVEDLFRDGYKAVFVGTGVWKPRVLGIKGESLGHVHFAIDYLKNPAVYNLGKNVCIIGAGNVAMDVARTAIRQGSRNVTILYRKGENEITALPHEVEYAKLDGVNFEFYKMPLEIIDDGVKYIMVEPSSDEDDIQGIPGTEDIFEADSVIISVSQGPRANIVNNSKGINIDNKGLIITDEYGRTTKEGIFASGDVVTGAKTVVEAVRRSKMVAQAIEEYVLMKIS